jgi:hypothetical protein
MITGGKMKNRGKCLIIAATACLLQVGVTGTANAGRNAGFARAQAHKTCTQLKNNCVEKKSGKEAVCKRKFAACMKTGDWGHNHGVTRY